MKSTVTFPTPGEATTTVLRSASTIASEVNAQPFRIMQNGVLVGTARTLDLVDTDDVTFTVSIDAETGAATIEANAV